MTPGWKIAEAAAIAVWAVAWVALSVLVVRSDAGLLGLDDDDDDNGND